MMPYPVRQVPGSIPKMVCFCLSIRLSVEKNRLNEKQKVYKVETMSIDGNFFVK